VKVMSRADHNSCVRGLLKEVVCIGLRPLKAELRLHMIRAQRGLVHHGAERDLFFQMGKQHGPGEISRPDCIYVRDRGGEFLRPG